MSYVVSARKYRPATFDTVVGQRAVTTTLRNAISTGRLAHAYLFCGPRGVGKTTCARIFAKTINCLNPTPEGEACDQCESCVAFREQRSYNIHELDAASNNSVDDIRQLVEQVRIPPQIGHYKVYIIDEVHMLSASAFNAFLKTLEEPPRHAIFILATTEKHKILPTILSRCQIYDFARIGVDDTVAHLAYVAAKEGITAEPEALGVIALKADGGMRDALSIFDQVASYTSGHITYQGTIENLNVLDYDYYFRLIDHLLLGQVPEALLLLNEVISHGFDPGQFITGLSSHLRDLLVSRDVATLALLEVGASIRERYREQAARCSLPFLYEAMRLSNDCDLAYRASRNRRLLVELTLIRLAQLCMEDGGKAANPSDGKQAVIRPVPGQTHPTAATGGNGRSANAATATGGSPSQQGVRATQPATTAPPTITHAVQSTQPTTSPAASASPATNKPTSSTAVRSAGSDNQPRRVPTLKRPTSMGISPSKSPSDKRDASEKNTATPDLSPQQAATPASGATATEAPALRPVTDEGLRLAWQEYASSLPHEQVALARRMQALHPKLLDSDTFEVVVDNPMAARDFTAIIPAVQAYLPTRLQCGPITMQVRISAPTETSRAYSRVERFQLMTEKNPALRELTNSLGLELY